MQTVAALYVRSDSVYRSIANVNCWDKDRDARHYPGPHPVVAHPPCARWGRYATVGGRGHGQDQGCGAAATAAVRRWGGVLEHPKDSHLWDWMCIPKPGDDPDYWGGYTVRIDQIAYGHCCIKPTWLYLVGVPRQDFIPQLHGGEQARPLEHLSKAQRERTPRPMALELIRLASRVGVRRAA